tara:strand:+ start:2009 stop:2929 length:921 start_codon:yes stop_codon:yes gene_type:complete
MRKFLVLIILITPFNLKANKKKKQDKEAIKEMCGCMDIQFEYSETLSPNKEYKFYDNYKSGGTELAFVVEETPNKIVIQHLLVVGKDMVIKHWRQDWVYEGKEMYIYDKDQRWVKKEIDKKDRKGKWIQKVYQVDDSPRYEGIGTWVMVDGKKYWESTTDAPLPRREYSKRSDYNVLERRNKHEIKGFGWIHEQDNRKILRKKGDLIIAEEKGRNTYKKVDSKKCLSAEIWWEENKIYWRYVRSIWNEYYNKKSSLSLHNSINNTPMFSEFFKLGDEYKEIKNITLTDAEVLQSKIKSIINNYLKE